MPAIYSNFYTEKKGLLVGKGKQRLLDTHTHTHCWPTRTCGCEQGGILPIAFFPPQNSYIMPVILEKADKNSTDESFENSINN